MPERDAPLTVEEMAVATEQFSELFAVIAAEFPDANVDEKLRIMENVARLAQKKRADDREDEATAKFGFNKKG